MIRLSKRSVVGFLCVVLCVSVLVHAWFSIQWVFTDHDYTPIKNVAPTHTSLLSPTATTTSTTFSPSSPSSSSSSSSSPSYPTGSTKAEGEGEGAAHGKHRYERDYTTLIAYSTGLVVIYCSLVINTRYRLFPILLLTSTKTNTNTLESQKPPLSQQQQKQQKQRRYTTAYLIWRRLWHYEVRLFDITFIVSRYVTLGALVGIHLLFVFWPILDLRSGGGDFPYLKHQLIANRTAQLAIVDFAMVVGLSVRTSAIWRCVGLFNSSFTLPWHRWFARLGVICVVYHGCFQWTKHYYRHFFQLQQQQHHQTLGLQNDTDAVVFTAKTWWNLLIWNTRYLTGTLMALCLLLLFLGSHPLIRLKWYSFFRSSHLLGYVGLVLLGMWHHWAFAVFYVPVLGLWLIDVISRWRSTRLASVLALEPITDDVVKLQVALLTPPTSRLLPGQFVFCSFSGSKWKDVIWPHPFSISRLDKIDTSPTSTSPSTSSHAAQLLTFYIKASGRHTKKLHQAASTKESWPPVRVGSPLGESLLFCDQKDIYGFYPVVVLVAEGIGITPWISVIQSLGNGTCMGDQDRFIQTQDVHIVWTVRDASLVAPLVNDMENMVTTTENKGAVFLLHWHIYVTGLHHQHPHHTSSQHYTNNDDIQLQENGIHAVTSLQHQYQKGRPNYPSILESIRSQHDDKDVMLGICAHEESIRQCGNLARSRRFSHANAFWNVKAERFEL